MTKLLRLEGYTRLDHAEITSRVRTAVDVGGGAIGDVHLLPDRSACVEFAVASDGVGRFRAALAEAELQLSQSSEELLGHLVELGTRAAAAARAVTIPGTLQISCRPDQDDLTVDTPPAPDWWWWDWYW